MREIKAPITLGSPLVLLSTSCERGTEATVPCCSVPVCKMASLVVLGDHDQEIQTVHAKHT